MAKRGQVYLFLAPQFLLFKNQPTTHLASSDAKCKAISSPIVSRWNGSARTPSSICKACCINAPSSPLPPDVLGIRGQIYQVAQAESGKHQTRYKLSTVPLALRTPTGESSNS